MPRLAPPLLFTLAALVVWLAVLLLRPMEHPAAAPPAFSVDEQHLIAATRFGEPRRWDLAAEDRSGTVLPFRGARSQRLDWWLTGRDTLFLLRPPSEPAAPVRWERWNSAHGTLSEQGALASFPRNARVVPSADGSCFAAIPTEFPHNAEAVLLLYAADSPASPRRIGLAREPRSVSFSRSGDRLLLRDAAGWVEVWETAEPALLTRFALDDLHAGSAAEVALAPGGTAFVLAARGLAELRGVEDRGVLQAIELPPLPWRTSDFSADGQLVLLTAGEATRIWDLGYRRVEAVPPIGGEARLSPSGRYVAASGRREVLLWDRARDRRILLGPIPWSWLPAPWLAAAVLLPLMALAWWPALRRAPRLRPPA